MNRNKQEWGICWTLALIATIVLIYWAATTPPVRETAPAARVAEFDGWPG